MSLCQSLPAWVVPSALIKPYHVDQCKAPLSPVTLHIAWLKTPALTPWFVAFLHFFPASCLTFSPLKKHCIKETVCVYRRPFCLHGCMFTAVWTHAACDSNVIQKRRHSPLSCSRRVIPRRVVPVESLSSSCSHWVVPVESSPSRRSHRVVLIELFPSSRSPLSHFHGVVPRRVVPIELFPSSRSNGVVPIESFPIESFPSSRSHGVVPHGVVPMELFPTESFPSSCSRRVVPRRVVPSYVSQVVIRHAVGLRRCFFIFRGSLTSSQRIWGAWWICVVTSAPPSQLFCSDTWEPDSRWSCLKARALSFVSMATLD